MNKWTIAAYALASAAVINATAGELPLSPGIGKWAFREELKRPLENPPPVVGIDPKTGQEKQSWLKHRISRCFFTPIYRQPLFIDELADDIDYYPDEFLKRLHNEGVNGIWLSVYFRDLATTSFGPPRKPDAAKRLAKLKRTVDTCGRHGIKVWILGYEPMAEKPDDVLFKSHPEFMGASFDWTPRVCWCPSQPETLKYLEESTRSIFSQVPKLAGLINISHGEAVTTCLSSIPCNDVSWTPVTCPRCSRRQPWELHYDTMAAMVKGMRSIDPKAEIISWFYEPEIVPIRREWCYEVPRHIPEGVTYMYNFESGAIKQQLGSYRVGGDYWLSFPGPAAPFARLAQTARDAGKPMAAKIQMANSHELATVPYIPAPGLLYRKFKAMRDAGVKSVMLSWFFGNNPGIMNRAAGELAYEDFTDGEDAFLLRLAQGEWGEDSAVMADLWKRFSDAYENYPLSNNIQYFGPFAAGVAWPLVTDVNMAPMPMSWVALPGQVPYGGDAVGESLMGFTIDEAIILADRMSHGTNGRNAAGEDVVKKLQAKYADNVERSRDLGVMRALHLQLEQGADIYRFYRLRSEAVFQSRICGNSPAALAAVKEMRKINERAREITDEMDDLCKADSLLGFHSEAQAYLYFPSLFAWRRGKLDESAARLDAIMSVLKAGGAYPESEFEKKAARAKMGEWNEGKGLRWKAEKTAAGGLELVCEYSELPDNLIVSMTDAVGVTYPIRVLVRKDTGKVEAFPSDVCEGSVVKKDGVNVLKLSFPAGVWQGDARLFPAWICFLNDAYPPAWADVLWPNEGKKMCNRLNLNWVHGDLCGRLSH